MTRTISTSILLVCCLALVPQPLLDVQAQEIGATDDDIRRFCTNITNDLQEKRYAEQLADLEALSAKVEERIALAEKKSSELKEWVRQRKDFSEQATESIVSVYGAMKPRSAAERMEEIDANLASAILMKLKARDAGAILNEMTPESAGEITQIMAAFARDENGRGGK